MSRHDPLVRLRHMVDFARRAMRIMEGRSRDQFASNETLIFAEARLVEVIGEAANYVPREIQAQMPGIPWHKVVGMRNHLIHGYDLTSIDDIYDTVIEDLPPLVDELESFLAGQGGQTP
jgi:uncharacterized protein with HEPN domain